MLKDQLRRPWPFTWIDLVTSNTTWPHLRMFKEPVQNLTLWPWRDPVTYFSPFPYPSDYTTQVSRWDLKRCWRYKGFIISFVTTLYEYISIIYANRSIKVTLTFHVTWLYYVTHHVTSFIDVPRACVKFDNVSLTWPGDLLLHICPPKTLCSSAIMSIYWIVLFSHIPQVWNPYNTSFIHY